MTAAIAAIIERSIPTRGKCCSARVKCKRAVVVVVSDFRLAFLVELGELFLAA